MKINLVVTSEGFRCANDDDYEKKRKLKVGSVVEGTFREYRNYAFLKKFFALLNCSWSYLSEGQQAFFKDNVEKFRETLLIATGYTETFYDIGRQAWLERARSIAFDSMSESEFSDFYERAKDVIYRVFIPEANKDEFEQHLKWF